ncbi:VAV protein, partial [Centropus unirufus]|nr:VAV protein [Centropus unirufus]
MGQNGLKRPKLRSEEALGVPWPPHHLGSHWVLLAPQNKSQRPGPEKKRDLGLPKMEANQPYSGVPPPPGSLGPALRLSPGDVVEVTVAEAEQLWWQVGIGPPCWGWDLHG